jgi:hypothetical protein
VRRYRTEIVIPQDRVVGLHLPDHLPAGRAVVTILIVEPEPGDHSSVPDHDSQDIEWWEEFGTDLDDDQDLIGLSSRLTSFEPQV